MSDYLEKKKKKNLCIDISINIFLAVAIFCLGNQCENVIREFGAFLLFYFFPK